MTSRRSFLKAGAALGTASALPLSFSRMAFAQATALLDAVAQPKFVKALPNPLAPGFTWSPDSAGGTAYTLKIREFTTQLGLVNPATGAALSTRVWGYGSGAQAATFPGRSFNVRQGTQITVQYKNELMGAGGAITHRLPVDTTLGWANPGNLGGRAPVPLVAHRHGGNQAYLSDGLPDGWATPDTNGDTLPDYRGRLYSTPYTFDNSQEAGHLWYHDHALGVTRLNVFMGLAGNYFIRDANEDALVRACKLPQYPYEIPVVIQDRMFTADGQLHYPAQDPANPDAPNPTHLPEFFGDVILVNGVPWPKLDVEPRQYRLRLLNGSDSRVYTLEVRVKRLLTSYALPFHQIGTDLGLLNSPVQLNRLTLAPGERADIVVDFGNPLAWFAQSITLRNTANAPFPNGVTPDARTNGQIMAFKISKLLNLSVPLTTLPGNLRPVHGALPQPSTANAKVRKLFLFEGTDAFGRLQTMLGTVNPASGNPAGPNWGTFLFTDPVTENIKLGDTEVWEVYNTTADAHPIHLHLVDFRILNRQGFTGTLLPKPMGPGNAVAGGYLTGISLTGAATPAPANEAGRKDTALMYPGQVTRLVATFNRPGEYVWHCHILSHEDHEMMRRFVVA